MLLSNIPPTDVAAILDTLDPAQRELLQQSAPALVREYARRDFRAFLMHVRVLEPPPGGGIVSWQPWPHLLDALRHLLTHRLLLWLKARQTGASWLLAAYSLWRVLRERGVRVALLSQGEVEAADLLGKVRIIWQHLPDYLREPLTTDNTTQMEWGSRLSGIRAYPSTARAGRGATFSLVIMDEADHHEYFDDNYAAIKPSIDAGGQLVVVSTANWQSIESGFKQLWRGAPGNGFAPLFWGWRERPGRDEAWYEARKAEATDLTRFAKEYPATASEALAAPQTIAAFPVDILEAMRQECRAAVTMLGGLPIAIYRHPEQGKRYVAATDTSHGVGEDYSVTVLMDAATGYIVADIIDNQIAPSTLWEWSNTLLRHYGSKCGRMPLWAIESNDQGAVVLTKVLEDAYPTLYYRDARHEKPGWLTNASNRDCNNPDSLWNVLIEAVQARAITVPNERGLQQFFEVVRNAQKAGRIEALQGGHDDYPIACAIALQARRYAGQGIEVVRAGAPLRLPALW